VSKNARSSRERSSFDLVQRTPKADELVVLLWIRAIAVATEKQDRKEVEDHVVDLFKLAEPPYRPQIQA
jgi:hypothetical protein